MLRCQVISKLNLSNLARRSIGFRNYSSDILGENMSSDTDKSTVTFLNKKVGYLMIEATSRDGFRLNNNYKVLGSIAMLPTMILSWDVQHHSQINEKSLSLFKILHPKPDVVVIGIGDEDERFDAKQFLHLKKLGFNLECLPTSRAIGIYNFMCAEGRAVACGMIPPYHQEAISHDDVFLSRTADRVHPFDVPPEPPRKLD